MLKETKIAIFEILIGVILSLVVFFNTMQLISKIEVQKFCYIVGLSILISSKPTLELLIWMGKITEEIFMELIRLHKRKNANILGMVLNKGSTLVSTFREKFHRKGNDFQDKSQGLVWIF
jgi:hypothetical protein